MRAEIKPKFHNRFDIVVTNVETGEVELRGQAENMVLNRIYTRLVAFSSYFDQIVFGTGSGTMDPTINGSLGSISRFPITLSLNLMAIFFPSLLLIPHLLHHR